MRLVQHKELLNEFMASQTFSDESFVFLHNSTPCHKVKSAMKFLENTNIKSFE